MVRYRSRHPTINIKGESQRSIIGESDVQEGRPYVSEDDAVQLAEVIHQSTEWNNPKSFTELPDATIIASLSSEQREILAQHWTRAALFEQVSQFIDPQLKCL